MPNKADNVLIDFKGSEITFSGRLFRDDAAAQLKDVVGREVQSLAERGARRVVSQIRTQNGTGFSAKHIVVYRSAANSLYARVGMDAEKALPPRVYPPLRSDGKPNKQAGQAIKGTKAYPASRVPFIVLAILESGRYGGGHVNIVRGRGMRFTTRRKWQHSTNRRSKPLFMFRATTRYLNTRVPWIREAIAKRFAD